jgi:dTDP-4-dehydrorhamnose reductase
VGSGTGRAHAMKVLILGGTGMLGHMACRTFSTRFDVFAASKRPLDEANPMVAFLPKTRCFGGLDAVEDNAGLRRLFERTKPDVVLNCIGIIKQKKEAHDAIPSIRVNSLFPHELAQLASEHRAKAIFFSTDCVFSGKRGLYSEADLPDPVDLYGRSKLLGEVGEAPHFTVRSSIIGRELGSSTSGLIEWFISQRGKSIEGYAKAIYTGFTTRTLCRLLMELLERRFDLSGVRHIASAPITKLDLLTRLNAPLRLGITISRNETFECDRSLDGTRFQKETGLAIPTWDEMLRELVEDAGNYDSWRR